MDESEHSSTFQWQDYLVFVIMLLISSLIGLYFGIKAKRNQHTSSKDLLTGSKKLPLVPVALSSIASFTSGTSVMGFPAEVYVNNAEIWIFALSSPLLLVVAFVILPTFYNLDLTNAYAYLELRFNKAMRHMGTSVFTLLNFIYMAAVLFAPSVALSQVTSVSRETAIVVMGVVCTIYTAIGGIRAVVWTDAFQLVVIWAGLLALAFKGASDVGGWGQVWETARNGSRLPLFDMNPDPRVRHTFWTVLLGGAVTTLFFYGAMQANLQRYTALRSMKEAKIALMIIGPIWFIYLTILCALGLVIYANFADADPLKEGLVSKPDQILPLFVLKSTGSLPGFPGLFVASIFSASISTLSSGINSMAVCTLEDLVKPCFLYFNRRRLQSERVLTLISMTLVVSYGLASIGMAYVMSAVGKTALVIMLQVFGVLGGPLFALIVNGLVFPCVNSWGAGMGMLSGTIVSLYFGLDPILNPPPKPENTAFETRSHYNFPNVTVSNWLFNMTDTVMLSTAVPSQEGGSDHFYLSYMLLGFTGIVVSIIVALLVSALTGFNKGRAVDHRTLHTYCCWKKRKSLEEMQTAEDLLSANGHHSLGPSTLDIQM